MLSELIGNYIRYIELNEELRSSIILMDYIEAMNVSLNNRFLKNKEIRDILVRTFKTAKEEINIISPWANFKVMDSLKSEIQSAVNRGVMVKILYGIGDFNSYNQKDGDARNIRTEKVLEKYYNDFNKSGCFKIHKGNTHVKLLICDNKYYVQGSFNYLSFDGSYKDDDLRDELASYSESSTEIQELKKAYFNF